MRIRLIKTSNGNFIDYLKTCLKSLKLRHVTSIIIALIFVQLLANHFILNIEKEKIDFFTALTLVAIFPGFLIIAFFCFLFVFQKYKGLEAEVTSQKFEIMKYKEYLPQELTSIEVFGPYILTVTFNDGKVFYFVSDKTEMNVDTLKCIKNFNPHVEVKISNLGKISS